jgi:hypothetical protein
VKNAELLASCHIQISPPIAAFGGSRLAGAKLASQLLAGDRK